MSAHILTVRLVRPNLPAHAQKGISACCEGVLGRQGLGPCHQVGHQGAQAELTTLDVTITVKMAPACSKHRGCCCVYRARVVSVPLHTFVACRRGSIAAALLITTCFTIVPMQEPVAFSGGIVAGLLGLKLEEDPLREWLERTSSGAKVGLSSAGHSIGNLTLCACLLRPGLLANVALVPVQ